MIMLISNSTFASENEDYLDELRYVDLQVAAVTTDMYLYLGWGLEEKDMMKDASQKAIANLNEFKTRLTNLSLPNELGKLENMSLELIDRLQKIYNGIEKKKIEEIKEEFSPFNELYLQYSEEFKDVYEKYSYEVEFAEDYDPIDEEIKLIQDQKDKDVYLNVVELIKNKNYTKAYGDLNNLRSKYKDTSFEDCIMLKLSDCLLMKDSDIEEEGRLKGSEHSLEILTNIIDKADYAPILYEAFYKWRTVTQELYHGMSNMSDIPNKEYNEKRWQVIQTIKKYSVDNPNDVWAKAQIVLLLDLLNIQRGGSFGNDNLIHWGILYSDIKPEGNVNRH